MITITHDEKFLRRFRTKDRVVSLGPEELRLLSEAAGRWDAYA